MNSLDDYSVDPEGSQFCHFLGEAFPATHITTGEQIFIIEVDIPEQEEYKNTFLEFETLLIMLSNFRPPARIDYFTTVIFSQRFNDFLYIGYKWTNDLINLASIADKRLNKLFGESSCIQIAYEVAKSLTLLKSFGVQHRGIHPGNVFVNDDLIILGLPSYANL